MGYWRIGADELATSRFAVSPLIETVAALIVLARGGARFETQDWQETNRRQFQEYLAADRTRSALVDAVIGPRWIADYLSPPPADDDRTFADALQRVRSTPAAQVAADLRATRGEAVHRVLRGVDLSGLATEILQWVWTQTVRPDWPRRRHLLEADVVARTRQLTQGGWAAAVEGMRPGLKWLGDGRLQINTHDYPPQDLTGARLVFVPCTGLAGSGWVTSDPTGRHAVVYPCSGTLADVGQLADPGALSRLLGPVRAQLLAELRTPASTTALVARTGYALGSVGRHLLVLREAGLIQRRRSGRSVLYFRTPVGDQLVRAATA